MTDSDEIELVELLRRDLMEGGRSWEEADAFVVGFLGAADEDEKREMLARLRD